MKIGVYDEHLQTAGGGEKHIGVLVEYLSQTHDVSFITKDQADLKAIGEKLNLDFSKVGITYWPDADDDYLDRMTAEYDLFINSTIFSSLIPESKYSSFLVFFPIVLNYGHSLTVKKLALKALEAIFKKRHESFYFIGKHRPAMKMEWRIREPQVSVEVERKMKNICFKFTELNNVPLNELISSVKLNEQETPHRLQKDTLVIGIPLNAKDTISIEFNKDKLNYKKQNEQVYYLEEPYYFRLKYFYFSTDNILLNISNNIIQSNTIIGKLFQKLYGIYVKQKSSFRVMNSLKKYTFLMANSKYTQGWIQKMYGVDSEILYPPIDIDKFEPLKKENIIMSAGRFFPPRHGHNKKQLEMIRFFKDGFDKYNEFKNFEYHLCGGVKDEQLSQDYLNECIKEAEGYPIFIHPNISYDGLRELYGKAKIFWHASGLGEDDRSPDLFEHFGMTTVESMSAGAVPIVIGKGGQTEIINEGKNGYTWLTEEEALRKTLEIIKDENLRKVMSKQAILDSKQYSKEKMIISLDSILNKYVNP